MPRVAATAGGRRILGVDPGSRVTGYGLIERRGREWMHVDNGILAPSASLPMESRLLFIYQGLVHLVETYRPDTLALEQVFLDKNPQTAIKLGQARGLAMLVAAQYQLRFSEYTPLAVKQMVVGYGRASKEQVQAMMKRHLKLPEIACEDASDALALALAHAFSETLPGDDGHRETSSSVSLHTKEPKAPRSWRAWKPTGLRAKEVEKGMIKGGIK